MGEDKKGNFFLGGGGGRREQDGGEQSAMTKVEGERNRRRYRACARREALL